MARNFKVNDNQFIFSGDVQISGDFLVDGTTTTINTTNLEIEDNTILLNRNEAGAGVTLGTSGIEIERGTEPNVSWLFDEPTDSFRPSGVTKLSNIGEIEPNVTLNFSGNVEFDTGNTVIFSAEILSDIIPNTTNTYDLGSLTNIWAEIHSNDIFSTNVTVTGFTGTSATEIFYVPTGTTAQRPTTPTSQGIRFNTTDSTFEGWNGLAWGEIGGAGGGLFKGENGTVGNSLGDIFRVHEPELNTDVTIAATENALCAGPLSVAVGTTLTVNGNLAIT